MRDGFGSAAEREKEGIEDGRKQTVARQGQYGDVRLGTLLEGAGVRSGTTPAADLRIQQVTNDSRKVRPGALFVAIHGEATDGNLFVNDAAAHGASAVLSAAAAPAEWKHAIPWIEVREPRKALAIAAANFYGRPANALRLVGVTGTNGKTTTASLIDSIIQASGAKTGLFGTIAYRTPLGDKPAPNTTPESVDLQSFFAEIRDAGGSYATM